MHRKILEGQIPNVNEELLPLIGAKLDRLMFLLLYYIAQYSSVSTSYL